MKGAQASPLRPADRRQNRRSSRHAARWQRQHAQSFVAQRRRRVHLHEHLRWVVKAGICSIALQFSALQDKRQARGVDAP